MAQWMHPHLDQAARKRVQAAVEAAEGLTAAEIVPVVTLKCAGYGNVAPLASLILLAALWGCGLSLGAALLPWGHWAGRIIDLLASGLAGWGLSHLGPVRRLLIPRHEQAHAVGLAAEAAFHRYGLAKAAQENGVLIFVALQERQVMVLAGPGISSKVGPQAWQGVCAKLLQGAKQKELALGFELAIAEAAAVLGQHFPGQAQAKPNAVSDRLRVFKAFD